MASTKEIGDSGNVEKMTVMEIKKFLVDRGVNVNGYNKAALVEIASAVNNVHNKICGENELFIQVDDMQIEDPLKMDGFVNDFICSLPFGP